MVRATAATAARRDEGGSAACRGDGRPVVVRSLMVSGLGCTSGSDSPQVPQQLDEVAMAKVIITTAGHTIEVEQSEATAEDLGRLALDLWQQTRDPKIDQATGVGFISGTERPSEDSAGRVGWRGQLP